MSERKYDIHARPIDTATYQAIERMNQAIDRAADSATLRWSLAAGIELVRCQWFLRNTDEEANQPITLDYAIEEEAARYKELSDLEAELGFTARDIGQIDAAIFEYRRSHCMECHLLLVEPLPAEEDGQGMCDACRAQDEERSKAASKVNGDVMRRLFPIKNESDESAR